MAKVANDDLKTHLPPIRCSESQLLRWQKMARRRGDNISRLVRQLLDEEYRKTFEEEGK